MHPRYSARCRLPAPMEFHVAKSSESIDWFDIIKLDELRKDASSLMFARMQAGAVDLDTGQNAKFEEADVYSEDTAAYLLNISVSTLKRWRSEGYVPYRRIGKRRVGYLGMQVIDIHLFGNEAFAMWSRDKDTFIVARDFLKGVDNKIEASAASSHRHDLSRTQLIASRLAAREFGNSASDD